MLTFIGEFLKNGSNLLILMVILPVICSVSLWAARKQNSFLPVISYVFAALNLLFTIGLYGYEEFFMEIPYTSYGFEFVLRSYGLSSIFLVLTAVVFLLIVVYLTRLKDASYKIWYLIYMYMSLAMVNGTLLSDDLGIMLFFAEGLLAVIFGILLLGNREKPSTAFKALGTLGVAVLTFMFGIVITVHMAHTGLMSEIHRLPVEGENIIGFLCIMIGALGIAGLMPFHSWTVNAADDSQVVFMAAFPGALLKILGVYIAVRVLDVYELIPGSKISAVIMTLGGLSAVLAGAMALVQKNKSRLMAYISASLLGLIVLCMVSGVSAVMIVIALAALALLNIGCLLFIENRKSGSDEAAPSLAYNVRNASVLKGIYNIAEKGWLDPYNWLMAFIGVFSDICVFIERIISWVYDKAVPILINKAGTALQNFNTGNLTRYLSLVVAGVALIAVIFLIMLL